MVIRKMQISEKEMKEYADAVSKEIFGKSLTKLVFTESFTLRLSLIARLNADELDVYTYHKINEYVKNIVFPDNRTKKTKVN